MKQPLVSVVCLCHSHGRFVREAIESVLQQTYPNVELIVVDDASTDDSPFIIREALKNYPTVPFLALQENIGNCRAFNQGLKVARGQYIIDLAADDILLPERIAHGVEIFAQGPERVGVHFGDAQLIDEKGEVLGLHSDRYPHRSIPQGDIYKELIERYFVCGPTTMVRKSVFDQLGGYDESLYYEDFDFWVRSSRSFHYVYTPHVLVRRRIVKGSLSEKQFKWRSPQQESTYAVCNKILNLNRNRSEQVALQHRIRYEFIHCLRQFNFSLAAKYYLLWKQNRSIRFD